MIKNIIFDFGDVLINLDKEATFREMTPFGFTEITPELDMIFKEYEIGRVSTKSFLEFMQTLFPLATQQNLIHAWSAMLLDFPDKRLKFLERLAAESYYRLFLLSNTNEMHINFIKKSMGEIRYNYFKRLFKGFYLSHEIGKRKPNLDTYQYVLEENDLLPKETLFIDDTKSNIDAAKKLNIHTWHLKVGQEDIIQLKKHL